MPAANQTANCLGVYSQEGPRAKGCDANEPESPTHCARIESEDGFPWTFSLRQLQPLTRSRRAPRLDVVRCAVIALTYKCARL
jgi:hypothetical protein